jgi:hypothetical protein
MIHKLFSKFIIPIVVITSSCNKFEQEKIVAEAEPYIPSNLYPTERLPTYFNRVAVMPCFHIDPSSDVLNFGDEVFFKELSKVGIFEPISVSRKFCSDSFGREQISSSDALPDNFLKRLSEQFGANGVLFIELHSYKPYRPLSIGVRAKLVDLKSGEFVWAIDETIDTGDASVMVSANLYQRGKYVQALSQKTSSSILHSPRLFTKFVAHTLFTTLPNR